MFTATPFVVLTCALLVVTAEGWIWSRPTKRYFAYAHKKNYNHHKRDVNLTAQEVEKLKKECLDLDMDPALGVTEDDVVTAFRKSDANGNGALLNAELGNFTKALEIYEACETVNNIV